MKTFLFYLMMAFLPNLAFAQKAADYRLGKWYAGVFAETYGLNLTHQNDASGDGAGWGVAGGYRLSPRFNVQLGVVAARQSGGDSYVFSEDGGATFRRADREYVGTILYAPLVVQYVPFGSQRRWQPYVSAGVTALAGRTESSPNPFVTPLREEGAKVMFTGRFGAGVRVRLLHRVHFSTGLELLRSLRNGRNVGAGLHAGLNYDFGAK